MAIAYIVVSWAFGLTGLALNLTWLQWGLPGSMLFFWTFAISGMAMLMTAQVAYVARSERLRLQEASRWRASTIGSYHEARRR